MKWKGGQYHGTIAASSKIRNKQLKRGKNAKCCYIILHKCMMLVISDALKFMFEKYFVNLLLKNALKL